MTYATTRSVSHHVSLRVTHLLGLAAGLLVLVSMGCSSTPLQRDFGHFHRATYRLTDEEIKGMQFFISKPVLAQTESAEESDTPTGYGVITVEEGTPGIVTEVGPNWIRVSFREDGPGVPFLAESNDFPLYRLATVGTESSDLRMVMDVPGHVAIYDGIHYEVVRGFDAHLACDSEQLQALIGKRGIGEGREVDE